MGKLEQIKERLANLLIKFSAVKTDKAVLEWDGDEDLKAGYSVYVTNEKGEKAPAADGEYVTEDGKTIVVKDGKVESITDPVAEVDAAEDKQKCAEDENVENPDGNKEDVSKAVEEIRKEVNELYKIVDSILDKIGESRAEADARFKKIEKMSAAKPAAEEIEKNIQPETFSDKKLEKFMEHFK